MRVSIIGSGQATPAESAIALEVGREAAVRGYDVVCGGLGGVMEAAAKGAKDHGGRTIGILPGTDVSAANQYVDVAIATGLGNMRNALVVGNGDGIVAIGGNYGTLSEIALGLDVGRPIVGFDTHPIEGVTQVQDVEDAFDTLERSVTSE